MYICNSFGLPFFFKHSHIPRPSFFASTAKITWSIRPISIHLDRNHLSSNTICILSTVVANEKSTEQASPSSWLPWSSSQNVFTSSIILWQGSLRSTMQWDEKQSKSVKHAMTWFEKKFASEQTKISVLWDSFFFVHLL